MALLLAGCSPGQAPETSEPTSPAPTVSETTTPPPSTASPGPSEPSPTSAPASSTPAGQSSPAPDEVDPALHPWLTDTTRVDPRPAAAGAGQEIIGVRTGVHDGYDRVVLDLSGDEVVLGWFAGFIDEAVHDPTGEPLDVEGDAFLQVGVNAIDWTTDAPDRYSGEAVADENLETVQEVVFGGLFEAQQQVVIGLDARTAYRVFPLSSPARIVIDIRHE